MRGLLVLLLCPLLLGVDSQGNPFFLRDMINSGGRPFASLVNNGSRFFFSAASNTFERTSKVVINQRHRQQCHMRSAVRFPCRYLRPSRRRPRSVHRLRPGDVQFIAALGDSLTAGTGALAQNIFQVLLEYRGVSFNGGGKGNWKKFLTLPNILKNFNPKLYGFSVTTNKIRLEPNLDYNLARSGATSEDIKRQARALIDKLKKDPMIDFRRDWKMVTIFIGHNDACSYSCVRNSKFMGDYFASPKAYIQNLKESLDILHRELPRTFVSIVPMADVSLATNIKEKPFLCDLLFFYLCPCLFDNIFSKTLSQREMKRLEKAYLKEIERLVYSGRYDTHREFTVVIQPVLVDGNIPTAKTSSGRTQPDLDYLAPDCFHFSQKLHAMVSRGLWNNLLEPVGTKKTNYQPDTPFLCPSRLHPYLATNINSVNRNTSDMAVDFERQIITESREMNCRL